TINTEIIGETPYQPSLRVFCVSVVNDIRQSATPANILRTQEQRWRLRYDVKMSLRLRFTSAIVAILVFTALIGCKPKPKTTPEVVRILRNLSSPYGSEMDRRIVE